jgi:hypothetical protein
MKRIISLGEVAMNKTTCKEIGCGAIIDDSHANICNVCGKHFCEEHSWWVTSRYTNEEKLMCRKCMSEHHICSIDEFDKSLEGM